MTKMGNPEALRAHKRASHQATHLKLKEALSRLNSGRPENLTLSLAAQKKLADWHQRKKSGHEDSDRGYRINPTTLAKEARIGRSTLYNHHPTILEEINRTISSATRATLKVKQTELGETRLLAAEYRRLLEQAQDDKEALKRENYSLWHRIRELEDAIEQRDKVIQQIRAGLANEENIIAL